MSMFVGMDLHKNYLQIAMMNEKGKVLENSKIDNNLKQVGEFFDNLNNEKTRIGDGIFMCVVQHIQLSIRKKAS
jgi:hypothetical protein